MRLKLFKKSWIWITGFLLLTGTLGFAPPPQNDDVTIDFYPPGFGTYYRPGNWVPLRVELSNEGGTINEGMLQLRTTGQNSDTETIYRVPISLARDTEKTYFLYASLNRHVRDIEVELLNAEGRVIQRQTEQLTALEPADILTAVVTRSADGAVLLSESQVGTGEIRQFRWSLNDIPTRADVLHSVDVMLLYNVDTGDLDDAQREAIYNWVQSGGHLIVHGGFYAFDTTDGLDALLPVESLDTVSVTSLEPLGAYLGFPSENLADTATLSNGTLREGFDARVLFEFPLENGDTLPFIVRSEQGGGIVDYVAIDPWDGPLQDYEGQNLIWRDLLASSTMRPGWNYGFQNWDAAERAVNIVTAFEMPSALEMLGFLMLYILLIGPANYALLRLLKRPELAWFTIPGFIIVFTLVAYFLGFSLRGDDPSVSHLSVVQSWDNSEVARVDGLTGVFSPRRTTYDLNVAENMTLRTIPLVTAVDNTGISEVNISQRAEYQVEDLPVDAGIVASFATGGYIEAPEFSGEAVWQLGRDDVVFLTGDFVNEESFMLEDAVLLMNNGSRVLGDIPAGESVSFSMEVQPVDPLLLPLGSRTPLDRQSAVYFRNSTNAYTYSSYYYGQEYAPNCSYGGTDITLEQVMDGQRYDCTNQDADEEENQVLSRRALMLVALNNEIDFSGGRGSDVYVAGWASSSPYTLNVANNDQTNEYETLYIYRLNTRVVSGLGEFAQVRIPSGMMSWTTFDIDDTYITASPYNLDTLRYEDEVVFRLAPLAGIQVEDVASVEVQFQGRSNAHIPVVSLWNWETGEWNAVELEFERDNNTDIQQAVLNLPATTPYLGSQHAVQIQIAIQEEGIRLYEFETRVAMNAYLSVED